eukprot:scaffold19016_cov147-Cylindrotheca_fusiformis.AAC.2
MTANLVVPETSTSSTANDLEDSTKNGKLSSSCSTTTTHPVTEYGTVESLSWSSSDTHATTTRLEQTVDQAERKKNSPIPREHQVLENCWGRILPSKNSLSPNKAERKHQLVVISGDKGVGKTELSQHLPRGDHRIFLYGSFSSNKRMEPLSAFSKVLRDVARILETNDAWRNRLQVKLAEEFASDDDDVRTTLLHAFPDLKLVVLPPSSSKTPPTRTILNQLVLTANKHRLHNAVDRILKRLAEISPLVMILDDIHHADIASLELLDYIISEQLSTKTPESRMIVVACCARNKAQGKDYYHHVNENHLFSLLNDWHNRGIQAPGSCSFELTEISLSNKQEAVSLASSTAKAFHQRDSLEPVERTVVKLASCLQLNPIPLNLLEISFEAFQTSTGKLSTRTSDDEELFVHLTQLVERGIFSWNPSKQLVWSNSSVEKEAQLLVDEEETKDSLNRLLRIIADGLVDTLTATEQEYWIYSIVDMYNTAGVLEEKENKTANVSTLNLQAARRAIHSGSSQSAFHYLSKGIEALKTAASTKKHLHQDLERTLHRLMIHISAKVDNPVALQESSRLLQAGKRMGMLDKLVIHETQLASLLRSCATNTNPTKLAQQGANRCFELLATEFVLKFPTKDFGQGLAASKGLMKLKTHAKSKNITTDPFTLLKMPTMTKPVQLAAMKLLNTCAHFCYIGGDARFPLVVMKSVELCQKYGRSVYSPLVYTLVGILMVIALDDCKNGIAYVNHALALLAQTSEPGALQKSMESQAIGLSHFIVLPWTKQIANLLSPLKNAYNIGMVGGDMEAASHAISNYIVLAFFSGRNLLRLKQECCVYVTQMRRWKCLKREASGQIWWHIILELIGDAASEDDDRPMDEESIMQFILKTSDEDILCAMHSAKAVMYTLQGDHQRAADHALSNAEHIFKTIKKHPLLLFLPFYMGISLHAAAAANNNKKAAYKKYAKRMLSTVKEYHKRGNPNVLHHYLGLEAETHVLSGGRLSYATAKARYKTAIDYASRKGLIQDAAILAERYGIFLQTRMGQNEAGSEQLLKSKQWFQEWGIGSRG